MIQINHNSKCKYYSGTRWCDKNNSCIGCTKKEYYSHHILVIIIKRLGDVLMTTSLIESIREKYPNSKITWLTGENATDILINNPNIDRVLTNSLENIYQLRNESFDWVINFDRFSLTCSLTKDIKSKRKTGFILDKRGNIVWADKKSSLIFNINRYPQYRSENKQSWEEMYHQMCGLKLKDYNRTKLFLDYENKHKANNLRNNLLKNNDLIIGICIGSHFKEKQKRWDYQNIINFYSLIKEYKDKDIKIVIISGPYEADAVEYLEKHLSDSVYFANATSVLELASYIYMSDILVSNDSFALHISNAFNKNVIGIFGPDNPNQVRDYKNLIKFRDVNCLPCHQRTCKHKPQGVDFACMKNITSDKIFSLIIQIIKKLDN